MSDLDKYYKHNPEREINNKDFECLLMKIGSLVFLLKNKNINPTILFINILKELDIKNIFSKISGIDDRREILKNILTLYPNLLKSKIIREQSKLLIELEGKKKDVINKKSRKPIQSLPKNIKKKSRKAIQPKKKLR